MKRQTVLALVAVASAAIIACIGCAPKGGKSKIGDTSPAIKGARSAPVSKSGGNEVVARIGRGGAKLELANGARIEIPPGSIRGTTEVIFKNAPRTTAFKDADVRGDDPIGPIVLLSPGIHAPEGASIVVSIPFSAIPEGYSEKGLYLAHEEKSQLQRQFAEDTIVTTWDYTKARIISGRAVAELPALSGMRLQFLLSREE